jgi:hypothetical protein
MFNQVTKNCTKLTHFCLSYHLIYNYKILNYFSKVFTKHSELDLKLYHIILFTIVICLDLMEKITNFLYFINH